MHTTTLKPISKPLLALITLLLLTFSGLSLAAAPINTLKRGLIRDTATGVAINGYDTVAYFTQGKPTPGSDAHTHQWQGSTWKFASAEHLALFKAEPAKYAPQYGGYCAYGVSQGYLVSIEPAQFTVADGKLYLNYNADVQKKWGQDVRGYNQVADAKFSDLLKQ